MTRLRRALLVPALVALAVPAAAVPASAHGHDHDTLLLSRTVYTAPADSIVPGVTVLPAGCTSGCVTAVADGGYPEVCPYRPATASATTS